ncbi:MAG: hypothetical protein J6O55_06455 [Lachnospiraceae bacterium]|nr:hypothetical protein [Lachnospiraceae bacterium]
MYELTTGDRRFIDESARAWKMTIDPVIERLKELPQEVEERIEKLYSAYRKEFGEYYLNAMREDEGRLADPILREFDDKWSKEHPEFYDMDRLFEGANADGVEEAKGLMAEANAAFREFE